MEPGWPDRADGVARRPGGAAVTPAPGPAGMSYADLVAAATVGVSRRPVFVTALTGPAAAHADVLDRDDPAVALLDAAALLVSTHRAGVLPAAGMTPPAPAGPAGPDTAPELPAAAAQVLDQAVV